MPSYAQCKLLVLFPDNLPGLSQVGQLSLYRVCRGPISFVGQKKNFYNKKEKCQCFLFIGAAK